MQSASKIFKGILLFSLISGFCFTNSFAKKEKAKVEKPKLTQEETNKLGPQLINAAQDGDLDRVKALIKAGVSVDYTDRVQNTILMEAVFKGHYDVAKFLIDSGADVNKGNKWGETPLMGLLIAVGMPDLDIDEEGFIAVVKALLNKNAKVFYTDSKGRGLWGCTKDMPLRMKMRLLGNIIKSFFMKNC